MTQNSTNGSHVIPSHPDIERYILGAILVSDTATDEVWNRLDVSDFVVDNHRTVYRRMAAIHKRGEPVDRITVAAELQKHNELKTVGGVTFLIDLDTGALPLVHADRYIEMVREDSKRRRVVFAGEALAKMAAVPTEDIAAILVEHRQRLESLTDNDCREIPPHVGDVWNYESNTSYLIDGLIAERSITMISGESGDGKSMLALAFASAVAEGSPILGRSSVQRPVIYLDRENPLHVVKDRLHLMKIRRQFPHFRIWGGWEKEEPPHPRAAMILDYARRAQPFLVFDPLIRFMGCDENDSSQVRAQMKYYRDLTEAGATILVLHHRSEKGEADYRGSSDFRAAIDTGWKLSRDDQTAPGEQLGRLELKPYKTRIEPQPTLRIQFDGGAFYPVDAPPRQPIQIIRELVLAFPGSTQKDLVGHSLRHGLTRYSAMAAIEQAMLQSQIGTNGSGGGKGKTLRYYPPTGQLEL